MIKGILFDKDGTLIDFYALWLKGARTAVPQLVERLLANKDTAENKSDEGFIHSLEEELLASIGVFGDKVDSEGALAWKTYADIGADMNAVLKAHGIGVEDAWVAKAIQELLDVYIQSPQADIRPLADLSGLFKELRQRGIYVGLATADTQECARWCLQALGVLEYFDYLGADDGILKPKPEPDMFVDFAGKFKLEPHEVAVAGDTRNDMRFAKRCGGIGIGVLSGTGVSEDFAGLADYVLASVGDIPGIL